MTNLKMKSDIRHSKNGEITHLTLLLWYRSVDFYIDFFRIRKDLGQILPRRRVTRSRLAIVEIEGSESEGESIGDLAPYDNGSQVSFLSVTSNDLIILAVCQLHSPSKITIT